MWNSTILQGHVDKTTFSMYWNHSVDAVRAAAASEPVGGDDHNDDGYGFGWCVVSVIMIIS